MIVSCLIRLSCLGENISSLIKSSLLGLLSLALIVGLTACGGGGGFTIEEPMHGSIHSSSPPLFKVGHKSKFDKLPSILLNGLEVREFFSSDNAGLVADSSN